MLALAFLLQAATAPPQARGDVVVRGQRIEEREASRQIDRILPPTAVDQPLARFQTTVCPGVMGLAPGSAQAIVDRIGMVADTLGLRVGEPGCAANLLLVVTDDADAAIRRLAARGRGMFHTLSLADLRRVTAEAGAARGWSETEVRSRDGERQTMAEYDDILPPTSRFGGMAPQLLVPTASRIALGFRRDISRSYVIIDAAAVRGRDTTQIADYVAMRGLAGIRPDRERGAFTILAAFTANDATAPPALTDVDWGILHGLYSGQGNRPSGLKRSEMIRNILHPDTKQRDHP